MGQGQSLRGGGGPRGLLHSTLLAHAFAGEIEAIGIVYDAIEDGVGESWIADKFVPAADGELRSDDKRTTAVAILDDFEQIALLFGQHRFGSQIVDDEESDARQLAHEFVVTAIAMGKGESREQPWEPLIEHGEILAACLEAESTCEPRFTDTGRSHDILPKNSSQSFKSITHTILAQASGVLSCDPFNIVVACTSSSIFQTVHEACCQHG